MLTRDTLLAGWPAPAEIRETHVSLVLLTKDRAYKFKKAVRLPFLDLRDPRRREELCREELRLNRELCRDVYKRVVAVTREPTGKLAVDGDGKLVEYAVEMRRLPQNRMVDELLAAGHYASVAKALPEIVDRLVKFHGDAPRADEQGAPEVVQTRFRSVLAVAAKRLPSSFAAPLVAYIEEGLEARRALFAARAGAGFCREGHGDLHAGNICLAPRGVRIYDRLEFDRDLRCGDVAFDVAFLAMSLDRYGARRLGRTLRKRYAEATDDAEFDDLCSFYRVQRALVRANVATMQPGDADAIGAYDRLALGYALAPVAVLLCGLPATGKSTRAKELAGPLDARIVSSDLIRKRLLGLERDERWHGGFHEGPYRPGVTAQVYERVAEDAHAALASGRSVIVDATLSTREQRAKLLETTGDFRWVLVHVERSDGEIERNLAARAAAPDVSDADRAVVEEARAHFVAPAEIDEAHRVTDRGGPLVDEVLTRLAVQA